MNLKSFLPYILILAAFTAGKLLTPTHTPELRALEDQLQAERLAHQTAIDSLTARLRVLSAAEDSLASDHRRDSARYAGILQAKDRNINTLKSRINEISFSNASTRELDSIRHALYGSH